MAKIAELILAATAVGMFITFLLLLEKRDETTALGVVIGVEA